MKVIVAVDATMLWHAAATRADIHVHADRHVHDINLPGAWLAWFAMDGLDTHAALFHADRCGGGVNAQLQDVAQKLQLVTPARRLRGVEFCLTGDAKLMQAAHHSIGMRCWLCDDKLVDVGQLVPIEAINSPGVSLLSFHTCVTTLC